MNNMIFVLITFLPLIGYILYTRNGLKDILAFLFVFGLITTTFYYHVFTKDETFLIISMILIAYIVYQFICTINKHESNIKHIFVLVYNQLIFYMISSGIFVFGYVLFAKFGYETTYPINEQIPLELVLIFFIYIIVYVVRFLIVKFTYFEIKKSQIMYVILFVLIFPVLLSIFSDIELNYEETTSVNSATTHKTDILSLINLNSTDLEIERKEDGYFRDAALLNDSLYLIYQKYENNNLSTTVYQLNHLTLEISEVYHFDKILNYIGTYDTLYFEVLGEKIISLNGDEIPIENAYRMIVLDEELKFYASERNGEDSTLHFEYTYDIDTKEITSTIELDEYPFYNEYIYLEEFHLYEKEIVTLDDCVFYGTDDGLVIEKDGKYHTYPSINGALTALKYSDGYIINDYGEIYTFDHDLNLSGAAYLYNTQSANYFTDNIEYSMMQFVDDEGHYFVYTLDDYGHNDSLISLNTLEKTPMPFTIEYMIPMSFCFYLILCLLPFYKHTGKEFFND